MKEKILKMLTQANDYISGQALCNELNVSRTAIWKYMNQLKEDGYEIEAVTNRGYRLKNRPDVLYANEIKSKLKTLSWAREIYYYDEVDSTNNVAKKLAEDGAPHGTLVITEMQTAGKGRRGRNWSSPKGSGIWMTFILRPQIGPDRASMLTLVSAMAVQKAIENETGLKAVIKWPNDIVVNGKKVCGMLTEMSAEPEWINYVVVGIGINANTKKFPEEIADVATSLSIELGRDITRSNLVAGFGAAFEGYYDRFIKNGDMSDLMDEYNKNLANLDNKVKILDPKGEYTGISKGINKEGELLVTDEDGNERIVRSGEVSVRGIYGYV
ncbi:MAG: biotin--[acetyl-CoA-carboxylase] ligase [Lachnospiraceae bacterium]